VVENGLMEEFSIVHGGRYYYFDGYRYERLADAVAYARLIRARQAQPSDPLSSAPLDGVESPSASDRQLMLEYSIAFENGNYVFDGYRYDRLIDAANYANHRRLCGA
jgi:hypothetical protein